MAPKRIFLSAIVALMLSASSSPLQAHNIIVCKVSDPTNPVSGTFAFNVPGFGVLYAVAGHCSPEIVAPALNLTITENAVSGTELIRVWTDPPSALAAFDLTARSATINVPEAATVKVYFKNRKVNGTQGCTPGYWKNHLRSWAGTGYSPDQTVGSVFSGLPPELFSSTLLEALQGGGGPGLTGGLRILLRAAVAALLNAANNDVDYPLGAGDVIDQVNDAIASGDRATILALATRLDALNNGPGGCPLGGPDTR